MPALNALTMDTVTDVLYEHVSIQSWKLLMLTNKEVRAAHVRMLQRNWMAFANGMAPLQFARLI
jgi:hypothetical protein